MKLLVAFLAVASALAANAAGELDDAVLHGETDKARAIDYKPGETMTFTLQLQGVKSLPEGEYFISWKRTGDDGKVESGKVPASLSKPLVVKTSLDSPGFVRLMASVVDKSGVEYKKRFRRPSATAQTYVSCSRRTAMN